MAVYFVLSVEKNKIDLTLHFLVSKCSQLLGSGSFVILTRLPAIVSLSDPLEACAFPGKLCNSPSIKHRRFSLLLALCVFSRGVPYDWLKREPL